MRTDDDDTLTAAEMAELERDVVRRLEAARQTDRAPATLRAALAADAERARRRSPARGRRAWSAAALSVAVAAAVLVVVLVSGGGGGSPTVAQTVALAGRGPVSAAPAPEANDAALLSTHVGALHFPVRLPVGVAVAGVRSDRLDGRLVVTVYYAGEGHSFAYSIVASPVLAQPGSASSDGYALVTVAGRRVLAYQFEGHSCVISAVGPSARLLPVLATRLV